MTQVPIKTPPLIHTSSSIWTSAEPGAVTFIYYDCGLYARGTVAPPGTAITCFQCVARTRRWHRG